MSELLAGVFLVALGWGSAGAGAHFVSSGRYVWGAIFLWLALHVLVVLHANYRGRP